MGNFSIERRGRFVMFLGLAMLAIFTLFGAMIEDALRLQSRLAHNGRNVAQPRSGTRVARRLKWLNAREDARSDEQ
jgi:hypothetical protein